MSKNILNFENPELSQLDDQVKECFQLPTLGLTPLEYDEVTAICGGLMYHISLATELISTITEIRQSPDSDFPQRYCWHLEHPIVLAAVAIPSNKLNQISRMAQSHIAELLKLKQYRFSVKWRKMTAKLRRWLPWFPARNDASIYKNVILNLHQMK